MLRKILMWSVISTIAFAPPLSTNMNASAQTIPGIPDSELAKAHIVKGCHLRGANRSAQRIFGSYALAIEGSGHVPATFFPGGEPVTPNEGVVWCRLNRTVDLASDFLLVRYQSYSSDSVTAKGFNLVVNAQNSATPDNPYTISKKGSLTLAVRKYGEVMAMWGSVLASAAWYVPTQQPDQINRNVAGSTLIPMMFALMCPHGASFC
jgi:hypothetical protein